MKRQICFLASNLKLLRERRKKTQGDIAEDLKVTRAKLNAFENGVNINPKIEDLAKFTAYFKISIDSLLWVNLKRLTELQFRNLEAGNDEYIMGTKIRVLAITVDSKNRENIEIVPIKAKAGYTQGYSNPEFIESLQSFQLPTLSANRKFRMFQIEGDSMLPIPDKSFVISEFVENWNDIKSGQAYIVLTKNEGIVFKEVSNNLKKDRSLLMHSLNPLFKDYSIKAGEVNEVWKFVSYISSQIPESGMTLENLGAMIMDVKSEIVKSKRG
ncbi:MAG: LexA family transcriptional regulator [Bacteroidota bacterium]|nr:LexA family transcriptional regulator [Bacteroidota bacterium]